ncbi:MAG TPA: hypothetical protein VII76_08640 [Acidimicrobiales bacterium]
MSKAMMSGFALLGVGAVGGGIASTAMSASAAPTTTTTGTTGTAGSSTSSTTAPTSGRQRPGTPPGPALPLQGTITAVGASSATIKTSSDTETYEVTSSSDIEKNGKSTLSALAVGDMVGFSTVTTDGTTAIDTLVAGGCGPGNGPGANAGTGTGAPPNGANGSGSSSSSSTTQPAA